jgi:predicted Ser/Thr protein kinase
MDVHLDKHVFVDQRTGEERDPNEFLANMRAIEEKLARCDDDIVGLKGDLKAAREAREKFVAQLRAAVRQGKVLPLFDAIDDAPAADDGEPA